MATIKLLLIIITSIIAVSSQERLLISEKEFKLKLLKMRQSIAGRSLIGKWKLTEDNNFVINTQNTMINDLYSQNRHKADKINFL
jgi:hypothetical protein